MSNNLNPNSNSNMGRSQSFNHLSTSVTSSNQNSPNTTPNTPTSSTLDLHSNKKQLGSSNNPLSNSGTFETFNNNNNISSTPLFNHSVPTPPTPNAQVDESTLKRFIKNGNWNQVFKVADVCISNTNNPLSILQYKLCRVISHVKLRNYKIAYDEIQGIGDIRDIVNCFETYNHLFPNRKGTMVPFSMRIIKAELSSHLNLEKYQLDSLYGLLTICKREIQLLEKQQLQQNTNNNNNSSTTPLAHSNIGTEEILLSQVENTTSVLLSSGTTPSATTTAAITPTNMLSPVIIQNTTVEEIFELNSTTSTQSNLIVDQLSTWRQRERRIIFSIITFIMQKNRDFLLAIKILEDLLQRQQQGFDIWVLSILGRIHLQMGNLKTARDIFRITDSLIDQKSREQVILNLMNNGFLSIANDQYPKAIEFFDQILKLDPSHIAATNNKCISMLYTCDLGNSLTYFEALLQTAQEKSIDETLIFNICSLYELASDKSSEKKKSIMSNIAKKAPDNFDFKVFKISNTVNEK